MWLTLSPWTTSFPYCWSPRSSTPIPLDVPCVAVLVPSYMGCGAGLVCSDLFVFHGGRLQIVHACTSGGADPMLWRTVISEAKRNLLKEGPPAKAIFPPHVTTCVTVVARAAQTYLRRLSSRSHFHRAHTSTVARFENKDLFEAHWYFRYQLPLTAFSTWAALSGNRDQMRNAGKLWRLVRAARG